MHELITYLQSIFAFNPNSPLLFTQFQFWAFFAVVFAGFAFFQRRTLMRNSYLFAVSLLFYYKTSGLFVGLLMLVTVSDFLIAQRIYALRDAELWKRRALLTLSVVIDLGILCYFKYAYFFTDMVNSIFGTHFAVRNVAAELGNALFSGNIFDADRIILPVGISFYTFQVISYTADVYRGLVKPVRNILDFGFYVSFFPQLVAGPIIKASDFIPQLYRRYHLSKRQFGIAVFWIMNGLTKKIVLSDYLAVNFIDRVFDNPQLFGGFENLAALFCYSLQVYADFSGYTDIAIGLSLMMGFHLPLNFNSPYKAQNCGEFWKRWHISLSRWLQTYLYIPLGGNRDITFGTYFWVITLSLAALILSGQWWVGATLFVTASLIIACAYRYPERRKKIYANLNNIITMLLGGMWHGASMNFIIWGGLNGLGNIGYKFWRDANAELRALVTLLITVVLLAFIVIYPQPLWNVLFIFMLFVSVSAVVRWAARRTGFNRRIGTWLAVRAQNKGFAAVESLSASWFDKALLLVRYVIGKRWTAASLLHSSIGRVWAIGVTFTFITFTRLFFRSGSNLDPAIANETAWRTASRMITQMGSQWTTNAWDVICGYHNVFLLFVLGMIIHWLPTTMKRRYRLCFAQLPVWAMAVASIVCVFIVYQFVTAEMQPFIYFQF